MKTAKLSARFVGVVILALLWVYAVTLCARLTNAQSTLAVYAGVGMAVVLLAIGLLGVYRCGMAVNRFFSLCAILCLAVAAGACTRVDPGHVGIQVNYYGTDRGVDSYPRVTGMVWYNPVSTRVFEYPTYVQTAKWTKSLDEGHASNEEVTFTNKDGMSIAVDVSLSYHLVPDHVPAFYVKFRNDDLNQFTHGFLRNLARDKFDRHGGRYTIDQIMGDNAPFLKDVRDDLQTDLTALGVELDQFGLIGSPRPPQAVIDSINAKVHATQLAIQKQNELVQAQADAAKVVAKAEGDAKATRVSADADAYYNDMLNKSLTPLLVQNRSVSRWDGKLPQVSSGAVPFINLQK